MEFAGAPVPVLQGVRRGVGANQALTQFAVSDAGTVAYLPGPASVSTLTRSLIVASREGIVTPLRPLPAAIVQPRVSRDGQWVALEKDDGADFDIHVYRLDGSSAMQRLTLNGRSRFPIWSPRNQVTYQSERDGDVSIWSQDIGGTAVRLTTAAKGFEHAPEAWSPDGRTLLFSQRSISSTGPAFSLWTLTDGKAETFADVRSAETFSASFSPMGAGSHMRGPMKPGASRRTTAASSFRRFPADASLYPLPKERIDFHPLWAPDGREILFVPNAAGWYQSVSEPTPYPVSGHPSISPQSPRRIGFPSTCATGTS
jgi:Tol biopolymer transport system component